MNEEKRKSVISSNLAHYRKLSGLTQAELAEFLNYSDKSVSKWERGEGIPDIMVLLTLAEFYGITVNDLIAEKQKKKLPNQKRIKILVPLLSCALVWLVAFLVYIILGIIAPELYGAYLAFIFAIPLSAVIVLVFSAVWNNNLVNCISISVLIWSIPLCIFLSLIYVQNMWLVFLSIIPMQSIAIMWFFFRTTFDAITHPKREKKVDAVSKESADEKIL